MSRRGKKADTNSVPTDPHSSPFPNHFRDIITLPDKEDTSHDRASQSTDTKYLIEELGRIKEEMRELTEQMKEFLQWRESFLYTISTNPSLLISGIGSYHGTGFIAEPQTHKQEHNEDSRTEIASYTRVRDLRDGQSYFADKVFKCGNMLEVLYDTGTGEYSHEWHRVYIPLEHVRIEK